MSVEKLLFVLSFKNAIYKKKKNINLATLNICYFAINQASVAFSSNFSYQFDPLIGFLGIISP